MYLIVCQFPISKVFRLFLGIWYVSSLSKIFYTPKIIDNLFPVINEEWRKRCQEHT